MLISPLMGPINGIGLAVGTFDEKLLQRSVKNLIIMVLISLAASTLYFLISPISDARSELLARTQPTIFDVFIAFFGGLAGIVATSRKSQAITVISGAGNTRCGYSYSTHAATLHRRFRYRHGTNLVFSRGLLSFLHQLLFHRPIHLRYRTLVRIPTSTLCGRASP